MWPFLLASASAVFVYWVVQLLLASMDRQGFPVRERLRQIREEGGKPEAESRKKRKPRLSFLRISAKMRSDMILSGIRMRPEEYVLLWIFLAVGPAVLTYSFGGGVLRSLILVLLGTFLPPLYVDSAIRKRQMLFEQQLGDALLVLSNGLRAGFSFPQALENVARDLPDPIGGEFRQINRELFLGVDLEQALTKSAEKMKSMDMKLLTTAVVVQRQVGGNLAEILDTISKTIRDRLSIKRSVRTLTAQGRISGKVIGAIPLFLLAAISLMNPEYMKPFYNTGLGHAMAAVSLMLEGVGFLVINRIVNIKF